MAPDNRHDDRLYHALLVLLAIGLGVWGMHFILTEGSLGEMSQVLLMGLATFARVALLVVLSTGDRGAHWGGHWLHAVPMSLHSRFIMPSSVAVTVLC
jgi:hypothetical protein